jgi:hypothetical protein
MRAKIDPLEGAAPFEGAGLATRQGQDLVTRDYFKAEMVVVKNHIVRWMLGSQVLLIVVLVALANFTKLLAAHS